MACILHIETSGRICSVALSQDGAMLFHREDTEGPNHATVCGPYVEEALSFAESHAIPLDAVAVSEGPGSYTGLRIGVSTAKGVCYGRGVPLLAVSTLKVLCVPVLLYREDVPEDALLVPMIDARRMEVYSAVYDRALHTKRSIAADIVTEDTYLEYLQQGPVCFFGSGADKCRQVISHPNALFLDGIEPMAKYMLPLAEQALAREELEDVAYFEPYYLKEWEGKAQRKD
ncbi:MAG: tRNA (adenosine(37)-N6)-threonylcarbamoyltransferase complex dimerization subunit type 1 TsaB [Bacteroidaceae bacterium]|nr:tRNA (adenosine(37)-N6)-threonylcarbamoyltransferase complex dimerization subunit type 1 TsaB [Bacteroidaceae bacterium]MBQ3957603.1 tRNA (adenosine(37)-N6)-threonylcarbamoyltransferase complex dimerization subunit type 1 TsaB [Bacteroidaceae bacterium]